MINDKTAVEVLKSKGMYCIECSTITEYTAKQIKDIINLYRKNHPTKTVCVVTKNTESISEEGIDILCGIDNLVIRLASVYNEEILSKCNKKNLYDEEIDEIQKEGKTSVEELNLKIYNLV